MRSKRLAVAGTVAVGVLVSVTTLPFAAVSADDTAATVPTATDAWYATAQCASPAGCGAVVGAAPASPYPADTLHIGLAGGAETDRTYLSFGLAAVPAGASFTGGTLTVPLDTAAQDGSQSPDAARVDACLVTAPIEKTRASFATPPPVACATKAAASYSDEGGQPHLVVDLAALAPSWSSSSAALALVPAQAAIDAHETWHVVFSSRDRVNAPSPAATASLTYTVAGAPASGNDTAIGTTTAQGPPLTAQETPSVGLEAPSPATSFVASATAAPPAVSSDASTAPAAAVAVPQAPASFVTPSGAEGGPYRYPLVWLAPLAVLIGCGAVGRALTRDLRAQPPGV